jgi:hypothetical protein
MTYCGVLLLQSSMGSAAAGAARATKPARARASGVTRMKFGSFVEVAWFIATGL